MTQKAVRWLVAAVTGKKSNKFDSRCFAGSWIGSPVQLVCKICRYMLILIYIWVCLFRTEKTSTKNIPLNI